MKRGTTNCKEALWSTRLERASNSNAVPEPPSKTRKASNEHTGETYAAPANQAPKAQNGPARPASSHGRTNLGASAVARTFGLNKGMNLSTTTTTGVRAPSGGGHQRAQSAFSQSRYNPGSAPRSLAPSSTTARALGGSVQAPRTSNCKDSPISYPLSLHKPRKRIGSADTTSTSSSSSVETASRSTSWTSTTGDRSQSSSRQQERAPLGRALSELHKIEKSKPRVSSLTTALANVSLQDESSTALVKVEIKEEDNAPLQGDASQSLKSSVSQIPVLSPKKASSAFFPFGNKTDMGPHPLPLPRPEAQGGSGSPKKASSRVGSPSKKSTSPTKHEFLVKGSDLPAFDVASWDQGIEGRLESMEGMFNMLKSQMDGTTFEKSATKEMMELLRTQSKSDNRWRNFATKKTDGSRCRIDRKAKSATLDHRRAQNSDRRRTLGTNHGRSQYGTCQEAE